MNDLLENGRLYRSSALYKYSLGQQDAARKHALLAAQAYSKACDGVPQYHRNATIRLMKESMDLEHSLRSTDNTSLLLNHSEKLMYISSKIGESEFFPWTDDPINEEFWDTYEDGAELKLPPQLAKFFTGWKRPSISGISNWKGDVHVLYQDSLEDCSVVASLLSVVYLEKRTGNFVLCDRLFPNSSISRGGKYHVKLKINGVDRRIIIDDRLPSSSGRSLHVESNDEKALWPALFEKAYMKVMGGYDFEGSHACLDTYYFTGWLPEYISLQTAEEDHTKTLKHLWDRIYKGWKNGDLVLCLGTGSFERDESIRLGLIGDHDYTIIDMKESEETGERLVLIKNPWRYDGQQLDNGGAVLPPFAVPNMDVGYGSFWIDFDTVRMWFQSLYLNWNPQVFSHETVLNFTWETAQIAHSQATKSHWKNPQFLIRNESEEHPAFVTLLVMRHLTNRKVKGFMNLMIYDSLSRITLLGNGKIVVESPSINTSYVTIKFSLPPKSTYLAVLCANEVEAECCKMLKYTLSTHSDQRVSVVKAREQLAYKKALTGMWTRQTAGGAWSTATYNKNPQFNIKIHRPTAARLYAFSETNLPLNVQLFWSKGKPIRGYVEKDVLCSSGQYRTGCCVAESKLVQPGEYTAVVSSFEPGLGGFELVVLTEDRDCSISLLAPETAGLFCRYISRVWDGQNRQDIPFTVERQCEAKLHLYSLPSSEESSPEPATYRPNLRVSVYEELNLVGSSEYFSDQVFGIYLDNVRLYPGIVYIATIERMEAGYGAYQLDVFSSSPVVFDP